MLFFEAFIPPTIKYLLDMAIYGEKVNLFKDCKVLVSFALI